MSKATKDINPNTEEEIKQDEQVNQTQEQPEEASEQEEVKEELSELDQLKLKVEEVEDKRVRLFAEFENFRKRTAKERLDLISTASSSVIKKILPVLDDMERAVDNTADEEQKKGMQLIATKFVDILKQESVEKIAIESGSTFDTDHHEAITQIEAGDKLKGKIVDVVEQGYMIGDKVLRFAKVVVGK